MGLFNLKKDGPESTEKALVKKESQAVEVKPVSEETITHYLKVFGLANELTDNEIEAFKQMAVLNNLNPFKREIHCNAYGSGEYRTLTIVTGYEVYIARAEQSGRLEYWYLEEAPPDAEVKDYYATLVVKRRDRKVEQRWTAHYLECVQYKKGGGPNSIWAKQPRMMTRKVAMSQGFRIFFEDFLHGIPYTDEEMSEEMAERVVSPPEPKAVEPERPTENKEVNLDNAAEINDAEVPFDKPVAEPKTDYKKEIMAMVNKPGLIPEMEKIENVLPRYRESLSNPAGLKKLYEEMTEKYGG